jgi:hypothetical protein
MVPTIAQQLASMRSTMAETIIPALPADNGFAQEQAGLMLATLDWLADVQAHAYRYEVVENADYRELLSALAPEDEDVRAALAAPAPPAASELVPLPEVSAQNLAMKELVGRLTAADPAGSRSLLLALSEKQGAREAAWFKMTGFPKEPGDLASLL